MKDNNGGLKQAWLASPGPKSNKEYGLLAAKGFCMGAADIVPGVSGGTVAFITGIYDALVDAIRSFDVKFIGRLLKLDFSGALEGVHLRFLLCLMTGIFAAILGMARIMHYLLNYHPVEIWSVFFGLIAASIWVIGKRIGDINVTNAAMALLGAAGGYALVGMIPVTTPETSWFIFLCGSIAICAMILPGISGSFILLMLGKYEFITGTLKNPFSGEAMAVIVTFAAGACCGIVVFSRVLHYLLSRWHAATISALTGLMAGALRKVWPWKEVLETTVVRGKEHVLREANILPNLDMQLAVAIFLMLAGALLVLLLDRLSESSDS